MNWMSKFLEDSGSFMIFTMWIKLKVHNLFTCDVTDVYSMSSTGYHLYLIGYNFGYNFPEKLVDIKLWRDEGNRIQHSDENKYIYGTWK